MQLNKKTLVKNIRNIYRKATKKDKLDGRQWYERAYYIAQSLADANGITLEQSAGVLSALSPFNRWETNISDAAMLLVKPTHPTSTFAAQRLKARRIIETSFDDSSYFQRIEQIAKILGGEKTKAFYYNILGYNHIVTIDRHAIDVAKGKRNAWTTFCLTPKRYKLISEAYSEVARSLGIDASTLQAITWTAWRRLYKLEG